MLFEQHTNVGMPSSSSSSSSSETPPRKDEATFLGWSLRAGVLFYSFALVLRESWEVFLAIRRAHNHNYFWGDWLLIFVGITSTFAILCWITALARWSTGAEFCAEGERSWCPTTFSSVAPAAAIILCITFFGQWRRWADAMRGWRRSNSYPGVSGERVPMDPWTPNAGEIFEMVAYTAYLLVLLVFTMKIRPTLRSVAKVWNVGGSGWEKKTADQIVAEEERAGLLNIDPRDTTAIPNPDAPANPTQNRPEGAPVDRNQEAA
eukprot:Gregarina_sp_Poly_1__1088@NODE_1266_length_4566_cov_27_360302_g861_i0_p2_GENE_NODE_1266_length_4566_cov_27_360302_g861_i0NODE_1266_length_4566_cov_27_360302_g861_i0_p2_ORF_typecomplete_len263_score25_52EamA/PF00892_20/0_15EamA/PF00892_20/2_3e03_NODE_1266_length_4566_cov_27_360302_g861_i02531041